MFFIPQLYGKCTLEQFKPSNEYFYVENHFFFGHRSNHGLIGQKVGTLARSRALSSGQGECCYDPPSSYLAFRCRSGW